MPRRHYTDHSAPNCWLCDRDIGELCHVHDPAERRYLKDGFIDEAPDEPVPSAWVLDVQPER